MLTLPPSVKIHVGLRPIDMRAQFDGLAGAVRQYLGGDPLSGHIFLFFNRNTSSAATMPAYGGCSRPAP